MDMVEKAELIANAIVANDEEAYKEAKIKIGMADMGAIDLLTLKNLVHIKVEEINNECKAL